MNTDVNGKKAELKDRLRAALADRKMKPIELSEATGIPKSMISYYLSGKSVPKADRIFKISQALDVNEAWLMGYDIPQERTEEQKNNDDLALATAKMRKNPKYTRFMSKAFLLSDEEFDSFDRLLSSLVNK